MSKHRANTPVRIEPLTPETVYYHVTCLYNCDFKCKAIASHVSYVVDSFEGLEAEAKVAVVREIVNNYSKTYGEGLDKNIVIRHLLKFSLEKLEKIRAYSEQNANRAMLNSL